MRIASADNALTVSAPTTPPIAILDTGVASDLSALSGRLVSPFDATTAGSDSSDVTGHGTGLAAIAAGKSDSFIGVSPTSPVMPVRVYNLSAESTVDWLVGGINWAVQNHAAVIDVGYPMLDSDATPAQISSLTRAVDDAFNAGTLVVAPMGNDGNSAPNLPADLPHVLAVGASGSQGVRATFSNTGPWVDLVSPAASLVAPVSKTVCPSGFTVANATPFAAPAVAGAAALVTQLRPELNVQQRFDLLRSSATDVDPAGWDQETGYGLLNVQRAISAPAPLADASREVDDDPYYVRGANAPGHPVLLAKTKRASLSGSVSATKDPADVYPVSLKKNERLTATATVGVATGLVGLGLWKPNVGDFDVSNQNGKTEIVSTGGFSDTAQLKMQARSAGVYYLSVEAPDPINPDDPTDVAPPVTPYKLTLSKVIVKPHVAKKKKRSAKRKPAKKH